jgi:glutaredoxin
MSLSIKRIAGVLLFLLISMPAGADIYTWTDSNGVKHYANQPPANGKAVQSNTEIKHDSAQYEQWDQRRRENQNNALSTGQSGSSAQKMQSGKKNPRNNPGAVVMYTTPTCGYCKRARSFFLRHNIGFTDYDVTADKNAMERFKALNGRGVPLIFVGDKRIVGFNKPLLKSLFGIN